MTINILICTYNEGITKVSKVLMQPHPNITYKISHQVSDNKYLDSMPKELKDRKDVSICQIFGKGLCQNRNNTLRMADGDICFIADDDVKYEINNILEAAKWLEYNPKIDIGIGKIATYPGEPEFKKYSTKSYRISFSHIGHVSSIEMFFKRRILYKFPLEFDTSFGLGGNLYKRGEESVFLADALNHHFSIFYYPHYIVTHPYESSGKLIRYDSEQAKYYGTLFSRIFGQKALLLGIPLCVLHFKRYVKHMSPKTFIVNYYKGLRSYLDKK